MLYYRRLAILATALVVAMGDDCKDYKLSASDQSLIDMMRNYLHNSKKEKCPAEGQLENPGVTYTRWGRKECPKNADLVYTGQVGGNLHNNGGGGVNYLCLPKDPENGKPQSFDNNQVYGGEYEVSGGRPYGWSSDLQNKEVPCSVCRRKGKSSVLMIPARKSCYKGWTSEYTGYLLSEHKGHRAREYACVDIAAEPLDNKNGDQNGALFYSIRTSCGSLRCPPYTDKADVYCVVCTK